MKYKAYITLFVVLMAPTLMWAKPDHPTGKDAGQGHGKPALDTRGSEIAQSIRADVRAFQQAGRAGMTTFITQIRQGARGDAVRALQTLLALDPTIYPQGIVSGTYGPLTAQAVQRFQQAHGLAPVGSVGPRTLAALRTFIDDSDLSVEDTASGKHLCAIIPPGHLIAPGFIKKEGRPEIPTCQILPAGIAKKLRDIVPLPDPTDTTAPVISAVLSKDITTTTAKLTWTTDEVSKSSVWYDTSNPVSTSSAATKTDSAFTTNHSIALTGLTANTTYYYAVGSTDASGNASVSSQGTFTTLAVDTIAPTISDLSVSDITPATAKVIWTTNEMTTNKIWLSTTNPVVTTGAATMTNTTLMTNPSFTLSSLTSNTTYYYIVESKDGTGNTTLSSQGSFTTTM